MQKHPQYGLVILEEHASSENIKACAFEHHESMAGNGYPQRLMGSEIHDISRRLRCGHLHALTTKRSYNDPMKPTDAIS